MAESAYYAWSQILCGTEDKPVTIAVGEKVSPAAVGGKEVFDELVAAGSIRNKPYPEDIAPDEPPVAAEIRDIKKRLGEMGQTLEEVETTD
jgi:hypothetical protein